MQADEVQERRRRGKAETQTSDARFDERFKLGHAMAGKANTPWYAAGGSTLPTEELRCEHYLSPYSNLEQSWLSVQQSC